MDASQLPTRADAQPTYCERCRRVHGPFTQEDYAEIIAEAAKALRDDIDAKIAQELKRLYA